MNSNKKKINQYTILLLGTLIATAVIVALFLCFYFTSKDKGTENDAITFTVKFDSGIGVSVPERVVEKGKTMAQPSVVMTNPGKYFLGWYNGNTKWDFSSDTVTSDLLLVGKWEDYLTYEDAGDGSGTLWVVECDPFVEEMVIPEEYNGKRVTGIAQFAFANTKNVKRVTIPSSITFIANNAFNRCNGLEEIIIPKSVIKIDYGAFSACEALKAIYCEAEQKPSGWNESFNTTGASVTFGYSPKNR